MSRRVVISAKLYGFFLGFKSADIIVLEDPAKRDQLVIATKFTTNYKRGASHQEIPQKTQYLGNNLKSLHVSVEASLKKLRTDDIDILSTCTGGITPPPLRRPTCTRAYGKAPFVIYQGPWIIMYQDVERNIVPMICEEGMAFAPWNVLAAGKIRTDAEEQKCFESGERGRAIRGYWKRSESDRKLCLALERVAAEVGAKSITSVAIAWVTQKMPYVFPVIGGRKVEHLHANIEALDITHMPEHIEFLGNFVPFEKGTPYSYFGDGSGYSYGQLNAGHFDKWPRQQAILPSQ